MDNSTLVDVIMPVYNHEKFVAQAIESIIAQKANFKYRLIIGEDCSKDNSKKIIEKFAELHPDILYPVYHKTNLGAGGNGQNLALEAKAKYVAICEGDDYWIDPYKLQKQVDFMEANPDFSLCFADIEVIDELNSGMQIPPPKVKDIFTIEDFILSEMNIIPTATLLFRNILPNPLPATLYDNALSGDMITQALLADKGKAKYFTEKMAVYRNHAGGISKSKENIEKGEVALKKTYNELNRYFDFKYDRVFKQRFLSMAKADLIYGSRNKRGLDKIKHYFKKMPDYFKYSEKINFKEIAYYHLILFFPSLLKLKKK